MNPLCRGAVVERNTARTTRFVVEVARSYLHKSDEPNSVAHLRHADNLSRKDVT